MAEKFKVGDVVRLKSGGPSMTVLANEEDIDFIICQWFDGEELKDGSFSPESLDMVERDRK